MECFLLHVQTVIKSEQIRGQILSVTLTSTFIKIILKVAVFASVALVFMLPAP